MKGKDMVKALECCARGIFDCQEECPMRDNGIGLKIECRFQLLRAVLELINRLKEERNKYKIKAQNQKINLARLNKQVAEQKTEIERLNLENLQMIASIKRLKSEAIKEFLKRLEDESIESLVCLGYGEKKLQNIVEFETVEQIAKEMTEVEK